MSALFATADEDGDLNSNGNNDGGGSDDESLTPVGAIAGGTVGGVAGLVIIAGITWFVLRRRKLGRDPATPDEIQGSIPATGIYAAESVGKPLGYQSQTATHQIPTTDTLHLEATEREMTTVPPTELDADPSERPVSELMGSRGHH